MSDLVRTHVMLPRDLVEAADRIIGERKRSDLLAELLGDWLRRERLRAALRAVLDDTQPLDDDVPPEWLTAEGAARWVHDGRRQGRGGQPLTSPEAGSGAMEPGP